jgi:Core-2/I-Branching enzyme
MASVAAVVLAHQSPPQVRRLISALEGFDVFLHCDARTDDAVFEGMMLGAAPHVRAVERRRTTLASWSLVDAELTALRAALEHSDAAHVVVLSSSCYPLVPAAELRDEIARWPGLTRVRLNHIPYAGWSTRRNQDGGMWRFRRRFVTIRDQMVFVRGVPLRTFKRRIPPELSLVASLQWKIYARAHVKVLLDVVDDRPDLVKFWRTTLVPEESALASILATRALVGDVVDELRDDLPWCFEWAGSSGHPRWLDVGDFAWLAKGRNAPLRDPEDRRDDPDDVGVAEEPVVRKLFARKLSPTDTRLADMIDEQLRA